MRRVLVTPILLASVSSSCRTVTELGTTQLTYSSPGMQAHWSVPRDSRAILLVASCPGGSLSEEELQNLVAAEVSSALQRGDRQVVAGERVVRAVSQQGTSLTELLKEPDGVEYLCRSMSCDTFSMAEFSFSRTKNGIVDKATGTLSLQSPGGKPGEASVRVQANLETTVEEGTIATGGSENSRMEHELIAFLSERLGKAVASAALAPENGIERATRPLDVSIQKEMSAVNWKVTLYVLIGLTGLAIGFAGLPF
jgi:hypothetical protein